MRIGVCIATRGKVYSRTIESVLKNLESFEEHKIFFTNDLPIPDAQNQLVERALDWGAEWLFFVEEDMLIPDNALVSMLADGGKFIAVDYPVGEGRWSTIPTKNGEILWSGLGCTLIHSDIFKSLKTDWFETKRSVRIISEKPFRYVIDDDIPYKYGGLDILFGIKAREAGYEIHKIPNMIAGHMRTVQTKEREHNSSCHNIIIWDKINNYQIYE